MDYQKIIQGWDDRATCCVLVSLIQYAEDEIGKSTAEATDTILRIESCITKIAELIALGKLDLEVGFLKYYLLRVSPFSVRFNEALQSRQSGGLAFALAEISHYLFMANYCDAVTITPPDFTAENIETLSQAARFVLSRVYPACINLDKPEDMEWCRNNYWDDVRDILILNETLNKLTEVGLG
ncbi:hypothetical protein [Methylovulum miyakonense]|uniref:hypothetical protein n=1 Tax=Methylovulum miyakonense TaxID=645578 RepID=UPI00037D9DA9|nr:hypothetical protein [Methylovulum miyakonense]